MILIAIIAFFLAKDSKNFELKINNFHNEKNSSLESAMRKITDSYSPKPNKDQ